MKSSKRNFYRFKTCPTSKVRDVVLKFKGELIEGSESPAVQKYIGELCEKMVSDEIFNRLSGASDEAVMYGVGAFIVTDDGVEQVNIYEERNV